MLWCKDLEVLGWINSLNSVPALGAGLQGWCSAALFEAVVLAGVFGRAGEPSHMLEVCNSSLSSAGQFLELFIWGCSKEGGGRRGCLSLGRCLRH